MKRERKVWVALDPKGRLVCWGDGAPVVERKKQVAERCLCEAAAGAPLCELPRLKRGGYRVVRATLSWEAP